MSSTFALPVHAEFVEGGDATMTAGFYKYPYSCGDPVQSSYCGTATGSSDQFKYYKWTCANPGEYLVANGTKTTSSGKTYKVFKSKCSIEDPEPEPQCPTDTIPGGDINGGLGSGIYDVNGCAYTCGTNYSKLDGNTSMYEAQECSGLGQEYVSEEPNDYDEPPDQCSIRDSEGNCLDMAEQEGGSCPSGTTYGQVNGTDVCVPSGSSTDGLDEGSQGPEGEGGDSSSSPDEGSDGGTDGGSDGSTDGGTDGNADGDSDGTDDQGGDNNTGGGGATPDGDEEGEESTYTSTDCDTPPTCEGDAIQCGIAKELWKSNCTVEKAGEKAGDFFDEKTQGVGELGEDGLALVDSSEMDLSDKMENFTNVADPAPAECPQPIDLELSLGTYQVEFTGFCELADELRPLTLFIFSFLGALAVSRTVMGAI